MSIGYDTIKKSRLSEPFFSGEKLFNLNGMFLKFPKKIRLLLGVCSKGTSPLVILRKRKIDHEQYFVNVFPVELKFGNEIFENNLTLQQEEATFHTHRLPQAW